MRHVVERITALRGGVAIEVLEPMDTNTDDTQTTIPSLHDLVIDPLAIGCLLADQHDGAGLALHLLGDPLFYRGVSATDDRFPIVVTCRCVPFDRADLPNLRRPNAVGYVVKTEKALARHCSCSPC